MLKSKLEALFLEQSSDLIWMVDAGFLLTYANHAYLNVMKQVTGKEKKLQESVLVEGFGKGYIEKWSAYYRRALTGEQFEIEEHYAHPQTNEIQYGQVIFNPIRDENNQVVAVACQSRDITRIVKQRSEAHQLMDASLDVFCTINEAGNFVFVGEAATKHWGYTPLELIGKPYVSFIIEEDLPKTSHIANAILNGEEIKSFVNRYKRKDGAIAYNQWSARWDNEAKLMYCVARDAREKIEQENLLLQSEQRFKDMVQQGSDLISILDEFGNYTYVSPTSKTILGLNPEEFVGKSLLEFIHPEDAERTLDGLQKIAKLPKVQLEPYRLKNTKNEWRWIETVLTNLVDNPAVDGVVSNSRDITENVNLLKDIEAKDQFNRNIIESSPDCLKILDKEGQLLYMNFNGLCQMEIDNFSEFKNKKWWHLWGHENEGLVKESVDKALMGETISFTAICPTAKGTSKWWDVTVSPVSVPGEPIDQIIAISRDITAKKAEEQRLKLLESVITNTKDSVLITEAEPFDEPGTRILYVNDAFTRMSGYTAEEVIGKTPRILQGPKSDKAELARMSKALRNWEPCEITTINYKKNGEEFWVNFSVSPVADEKGWFTHWIAIERDVTEQKIKLLENELVAQISSTFNLINDFEKAIKKLCEIIALYGELDWVELWTPNMEMTEMRLVSHHVIAPEDEVFYTYNNDHTFQKGEGLIGKVWTSGKQILLEDVTIGKEFIRADSAKKIGLKSVQAIPLIFNNEVLGVLSVGVKSNSGHLKNYARIFERLEKFIGSELQRKTLEIELSLLFDTIPDIISVGDFKGKFLRINKPGCELLGYSEKEILQKSFEEFIHPEDLKICHEEIQKLQNGQDTFGFEVRFITKLGEVLWLSWYCRAKINEGLIYCSAKNITEEKKLRELNRLVGKLAKIGSWEVDVVNQTVFWSDEVHQIYGTDPSLFVPNIEAAIKFYREDFRELALSSFENCTVTQEPYTIEAVIVNSSKKEVWVRTTANAEFKDGVCTRVYGSFQDIHERKEAELRLQSLADNLPGVVFQYIKYPDGTDGLLHVSGGAELIWGFSADEAMQNNQQIWKQLERGGELEAHKKSIEISIETRSLWKHQWKYVMPNNEIKTHLGYGSPTFLADGRIVFNSLILDITEEAKNEELLKQASNIARIGSWEVDVINNSIFWSDITHEIHETTENFKPELSKAINFYHEDFRELAIKAVTTCIETGTPFDFEAIIVTSKNNEVWVRAMGRAEMVDGKCTRIFGSFQDINNLKVIELNQLKLIAEKSKILESIGDAFFAVDKYWVVTYWNRSAEMVLGTKKEDIVGKSLWEVYADAVETEFYTKYHDALKTMEIQNFEAYYETTHQWVEVTAYPSKEGLSVYFKDITQRKIANEAIAKSEEKRRLIMNGALDAIITIDTNETISFWNPKAEVVFGWKAEEVMGKQLSEVIIPEAFRKYHVEGLKNYLKTGEGKALNVLLQLSALRKNGDEFPIELTVIPIKQGGEEFFCAFIRDITDRKKAETELLSAFNEKNSILERITEAFVSLDANWCYTYMNKQAGEIFNRDPEKMIGKHIWTEFPEGLNQPFHLAYEKAMATQEYIHVEEHYKPYDLWFENHIYPSAEGLSIFFRDISERKRNEEKLRQSNERFEKVTEATNDAIWDWNLIDNTLYWGGGFKKLFGNGVNKAAPTLESRKAHIHSEDIDRVTKSLEQAVSNSLEDYWTDEYRFQKSDGTYATVIDRGVVIKDGRGTPIRMVGAVSDITQRKIQELELIELNQSLNQQAEELKRSNEELEQFAFVASHDLQEPLRMISSFMDQLHRKYKDQLDAKALQYIFFATEGTRRMKQIILDLLEFSRANRPADDKEGVDLNIVLDEYLQLRRNLVQETGASIQIDQLPILNTYKAQVIQIFHCLLDNAIKYAKKDQLPVIVLQVKDVGKEWLFSIKDNGIGIDPQFHEKIFIIFQRLHNRDEYAGTGVGLSIVKRSVEFLGGNIWLESAPGEGSTFYFSIPKDQVN